MQRPKWFRDGFLIGNHHSPFAISRKRRPGGKLVVLLHSGEVDFIAHAEVHGQIWRNLPVVLHETPTVPPSHVVLTRKHVAAGSEWDTQKIVGQPAACSARLCWIARPVSSKREFAPGNPVWEDLSLVR